MDLNYLINNQAVYAIPLRTKKESIIYLLLFRMLSNLENIEANHREFESQLAREYIVWNKK